MLCIQILQILKQFLHILKVETPQCDVSNKKNIETPQCDVSTLNLFNDFMQCGSFGVIIAVTLDHFFYNHSVVDV